MLRFLSFLGLAVLAFTAAAAAQDARTVTEPVLPAICATLDAQLTSITQGPYNTLSPADEAKLDTARIQNALDACPKGKAVALRVEGAANAFLSGPLELREGVTLIVDRGATLFASIDPNVFAVAPGSCGIVSKPGKRGGCKPLISANHVSGAGVMGDGVIDGRGGIELLGQNVTAWDIAQQSGMGGKVLSRLLVADHADNFTLYRITLKNSPNFHVSYNAGDGFTVWGVKIDTPHRFPRSPRPLARNTDGIDPGNGSKNITVTHSYIRDGDDNIAIKGGSGGLTNMTVSHNHFYWGHGMSIGSETYGGVSKVRVFDLTLDGTDAGIRIKSAGDRGGLVHDVVYDDICIRNSAHPIDVTMSYGANGVGQGVRPPTYQDITLRKIGISGGGELVFGGFDNDHRAQVTLDGVFLSDPATPYTYSVDHADVTIGPNGSNLSLPWGPHRQLRRSRAAGTGHPVPIALFRFRNNRARAQVAAECYERLNDDQTRCGHWPSQCRAPSRGRSGLSQYPWRRASQCARAALSWPNSHAKRRLARRGAVRGPIAGDRSAMRRSALSFWPRFAVAGTRGGSGQKFRACCRSGARRCRSPLCSGQFAPCAQPDGGSFARSGTRGARAAG